MEQAQMSLMRSRLNTMQLEIAGMVSDLEVALSGPQLQERFVRSADTGIARRVGRKPVQRKSFPCELGCGVRPFPTLIGAKVHESWHARKRKKR